MNGESLKNMASASPAKIGIAATGGAGAAALGTMLLLNPKAISLQALLILLAGLVFVAVMVLLYILITKQIQARANAKGDEELMDELRGTPRKITDPEILARMSSISRKFEEGVGKFKANGVKLTELPWYLIVGESGSGKTEVVRHSGIEFPAGLTEDQQGAGGTVNMDWWFTDHGVIIDTAGRYVSDKIDASAEWDKFLSLVAKVRKDCPVNGMLLVIPATSLLKDTSEAIQEKATKTAKFIDRVRRGLTVRFPVFVIITKSDLIPGFREFFENITDPDLQHQMLGWSKPGSLDEAFDPDAVDKYLQEITGKLVRRRFALLRQPPVIDELEEKRKVDSLYLFPDSLMQIAPRLRRYLQGVFTKSKFNQTPLFLRGIYFTSAMEEGAELDEALAKIRGITLEQLEREGQGRRRERAVFLRDLFIEKIFRESGLVTRAANTSQLQRRRKMAVLGAGFGCVALLFLLTWLSSARLHDAIGRMKDDWDTAVNDNKFTGPTAWTVVQPLSQTNDNYRYDTGEFENHASAMQFMQDQAQKINSNALKIPPIFAPMAKHLNEHWRQAYRQIVASSIIQPLIDASQRKMRQPPASTPLDLWTPKGPGTAALVELIHLQQPTPAFQINPLMQLADPNAKVDLQDVMTAAYGGQNAETTKTLDASRQNIRADITAMNAYWTNELSESGSRLKPYSELADAMNAWKQASDRICNIDITSIDSSHPYSSEWDSDFQHLKSAYDGLKKLNGPVWGDGRVSKLCDDEHKQILADAEAALSAVAKEIPDNSPDDLKKLRGDIDTDRSSLEKISIDPLQAKLKDNEALLTPTGDGKPRLYEVLFNDARNTDAAGIPAESINPAWGEANIKAIKDGSASAEAALTEVKTDAPLCGKDHLPGQLANLLDRGAIPVSRAAAIQGVVEALQKKGNDVRQLVKSVAELSPDSATLLPAFPDIKPTKRDEYQADAANKVMQTLAAVDTAIIKPDALLPDSNLSTDWRDSRGSRIAYPSLYEKYWTDGVYDDFCPPPPNWKKAREYFKADMVAADANLQTLEELQSDALRNVTWLDPNERDADLNNIKTDGTHLNSALVAGAYPDRAQYWQGDAASTIKQLMDTTADAFKNHWEMSEIIFWRRLQIIALDRLAAEAPGIAQEGLRQFDDNYAKEFPLAAPAHNQPITDWLNPDDWGKAVDLLQSIVSAHASDKLGAVDDIEYEHRLEKVRRGGAISDQQRDRLKTQLSILLALKNSNPDATGWAQCDLLIPTSGEQGKYCGTQNDLAEQRWTTVSVSPAKNTGDMPIVAPPDPGSTAPGTVPAPLSTVNCQTPLTFTYKYTDGTSAQVTYPQHWACLALLFQRGAQLALDNNNWVVPINAPGQGSSPKRLWLEVKLPLNTFPDPANWPRTGR